MDNLKRSFGQSAKCGASKRRATMDSYVFLRLLVDGGVRCGVSSSKGALQDLTLAGYPRPCGGVSDWYPVGIRGYPGLFGIPNV